MGCLIANRLCPFIWSSSFAFVKCQNHSVQLNPQRDHLTETLMLVQYENKTPDFPGMEYIALLWNYDTIPLDLSLVPSEARLYPQPQSVKFSIYILRSNYLFPHLPSVGVFTAFEIARSVAANGSVSSTSKASLPFLVWGTSNTSLQIPSNSISRSSSYFNWDRSWSTSFRLPYFFVQISN